jgi:hypothetical protein
LSRQPLPTPACTPLPRYNAIGVSCFGWPVRYIQVRRGDRGGFGGLRRRVSVVTATKARDGDDHYWEVIDLRHGGVFRIYRHCFDWFLPLRHVPWERVEEIRIATPEFASTIRDPRDEFVGELRAELGAEWPQSLAVMELLSTDGETQLLDPTDHESYAGIRGVREPGL